MDKNEKYINDYLFFQEGPGVRNYQYTTSGVKLLNVSNLVDGNLDLSNSNRYISNEEAYGKYKHFLCDVGDLIIASSGIKADYFDKKMGFVKEEMLPLCMNTSTIRFKLLNESDMNIKYFMYYLKSGHFRKQLEYNLTGSAQLNFGPSHLKKMKFIYHDILKQKEIVEKLDSISNMIKFKKEQLLKLDVLIKSQFVEMFGTNKKSKYPYESLENLTLKITDGKHGGCKGEKNSGYYFVGATEIYNNKINYQTAKEITKNDFEKDYKRCDLKNNDFVIVNTGATIGKSAIVNSDLADYTLLQKSVALIRTKQELINPIYLKYCYDANPDMYNKGNGCARINLLLSQIKETMIPVPPIELQNKFAQIVEQIDKQKFEFEKSLKKLEELQASLMQEYFG